jgi:hypothetical protein
MIQTDQTFAQVRKIDNSKQNLPIITFLFLILLTVIVIWFLRGGSFRFYASLFFGLYFLTKSTWISIVLVGVVQTLIFLPFRFINNRLSPDLKEFEKELDKVHSDTHKNLFYQRLKKGNWFIIFHMLNFILLALAFFSVGRIFFLDFYHHPINAQKYLYNFIPYPQYPIQGTIFHWPLIHITQTTALSWSLIFTIWGFIFAFFIALRLIWVFLRRFLSKNKQILSLRIHYNRLLVFIGGFTGTLFFASLFILRHIPISGHIVIISADLAKQNTVFNIITAICTYAATLYAGIKGSRQAAIEARKNNISEEVIKRVTRQQIKKSLQTGFFVALFAFWVTRLMPCSHDLSVLSFEAIYLISPFTIDLLFKTPKSEIKTLLPVEIIPPNGSNI